MQNENTKNIIRILAITKDGELSDYLKESLDLLSERCELVVEVEKVENLKELSKKIPLMIFDDVDSDLISSDDFESRSQNPSQYFIYINNKINDKSAEDVITKGFDLIIDESYTKPRLFTIWLMNVYHKISFKSTIEDEIKFDDIVIKTQERKLWSNGEEIRLTDIEFRMLMLFIRNKNQILSIKRIFKEIWGIDDEDTSRIVTQYIHRLKTKIGKDYISNISNIGYIWNTKK